jgi:hypothetical protein
MPMKLARLRRGRPQKFGRPARAVTLTLPEDVIATLSSIDDDLSRAVVEMVQPLTADVVSHPPAELAKYGDSAVIVVKPLASLGRIGGVTLVPLPDGRALISLDESMTAYEFELKLRDLVDGDRTLTARDRSVIAAIGDILRSARHTRGLTVQQRNIIVLQSTRHRRISTLAVLLSTTVLAACSSNSPAEPSPPAAVTLTAPANQMPADDQQLPTTQPEPDRPRPVF